MNIACRFPAAAALLAACALAPLLAAPNVSPTAPGATSVNVNEAKALFDRGARFVDVRLPEIRQESGHIPRDVALGAKFDVDASRLTTGVGRGEEVVFYCSDAGCANPYFAAVLAHERGYTKVYQLRDGFDGWRAKGLPVER